MFMLLCLGLFAGGSFAQDTGFLNDQKRYPRVRGALKDKETILIKNLAVHAIEADNLEILIAAFKEEDRLRVYGKNKKDSKFKLITSYKICAKSGVLGPKRKQGDLQVPEGFYYIDRFNPASSYHLSLGINYPNRADSKKSKAKDKGGDIFIHGNCVTIGCIPITDDKIKELYLYAVMAKNNGQTKIPVYIFPFEMSDDNLKKYKKEYAPNTSLTAFWDNLKEGFDNFSKNRRELKYSVNPSGDYVFEK